MQDPPEKISFRGQHWVRVDGGHGLLEVTEDVVYLAMALRNVGRGMGILDGWVAYIAEEGTGNPDHTDVSQFRRLTRDLYVPAGDLGFWQGAVRDRDDPLFDVLREADLKNAMVTIELLYRDQEGGQRTISRFTLQPHENQDGDLVRLASTSRHWNLDRNDPR